MVETSKTAFASTVSAPIVLSGPSFCTLHRSANTSAGARTSPQIGWQQQGEADGLSQSA